MAYIPSLPKEPLRIAGWFKHWEPTRIPTLHFIDAWTTNENDRFMDRTVPIPLNYIYEKVVVGRTDTMSDRERRELHVQQGEISFCQIFAKSGIGREDDNLASSDNNENDDSHGM
jgi:hypothetical protein